MLTHKYDHQTISASGQRQLPDLYDENRLDDS